MPISSSELDQMQARLKGVPVCRRDNASNTGKAFEAQIQESINEYRRQGIMWGVKVDPPTRIVGSGAHRKVIFMPNPLLDFVGVYTSQNGRAMHFEAKSTKTGRLPLCRAGGITPTQVGTIRALLQAQAIVFVLWRINEPKPMRTLLISGRHILHLNENMRASVLPGDGYEIEPNVGLVPVDFVGVMAMTAL
jgi:penicillin-binding protein-related factor A (putative recombinase)